MAERLKHIFIDQSGETIGFTTPPSGGGGKPRFRPRNRQSHSEYLLRKLEEAREENRNRSAASLKTREGTYLEFNSAPNCDLIIRSLENRPSKIRLLNIRETETKDGFVTHATVYIPKGKESVFMKKIREYQEKETAKGEPRNKKLIDSIENIRSAVLESFWQDSLDLMPTGKERKWCEIWLRDEQEASGKDTVERYSRFDDVINRLSIETKEGRLRFPERIVILAKADRNQLKRLIEFSPDIAEFRLAKETARFFLELDAQEQIEWTEDLLSRLSVSKNPQVAVTVLDTGANNGHLLLEPILGDDDCHTVNPEWGKDDHGKHGTLMCGLAGYGDLQRAIESGDRVEIEHCLESVKILPPRGNNDPELYGDITIQGVSRAEIETSERNRVVCMAITSRDNRDKGKPTSWSAAVDKLTSGADDGKKRLLCVAAGNVEGQDEWKNYPESNLTNSVHDPGQSWNALTVGAFTEKARLTDPDLADYKPIAAPGDLSPFSSTSLTWDKKKWPVKPDIVLEGGNVAQDSGGFVSLQDDISILSTSSDSAANQFDFINATSAATAQASWMAAQIQAAYPEAWPETIRGLLVHSAKWTDEMKSRFLKSENKTNYAKLLRTCGYGVPDLDRALSCYRNRLTLVCQEELQPFDKKEGAGSYQTKDMHLHELPWPKDILLALGNTTVFLKVTLSYFIEPAPGEVGWKDRYRYASHALRFGLNSTSENKSQFVKRINRAAREDEEKPDSSSGSERWTIGPNGRDMGSIHSDTWEGTGADLATCNMIGVYPVIGWWRERHWLGKWDKKARYSLIVSIETPQTEVDIYTPVANMVGIPIPVGE